MVFQKAGAHSFTDESGVAGRCRVFLNGRPILSSPIVGDLTSVQALILVLFEISVTRLDELPVLMTVWQRRSRIDACISCRG